MKKMAEDYLEETVKDAVITVPAFFTNAQRQYTKDAGQIAGLNVTRIINEPTAAFMACNLQEKLEDWSYILVYDLGGVTFDVSVLSINENVIEVKATGGDPNLGGDDFNMILVRHFKKEIFRKHQRDVTPNQKAVQRLTDACDKLKRNLKTRVYQNDKKLSESLCLLIYIGPIYMQPISAKKMIFGAFSSLGHLFLVFGLFRG